MLTIPPPSLPGLPLAAMLPTLDMLRRTARERRHRMQPSGGFFDETLQRNYVASETSLTLLLEHMLVPFFQQPQRAQVNATEHLQLAVRVLDSLLQHVIPPDQATPQITVAQGRRCLLGQTEAAVLVQVMLAVIQSALLDEALFLVVALPRLVDGGMLVEVEADAPGLAGDGEEANCLRQQLAPCLESIGAELRVAAEPGEPGSYRVGIWLPAQGL